MGRATAAPLRPSPAAADLAKMCEGTAAQSLGIVIEAVESDHVRGSMPVDERTRQPFGLLHGGASALLAETLGSIGANFVIDGSRFIAVGMEISANHLRPVSRGCVTGTARPVHLGRSTHVWDIRIEDEDGHVACVARLTLAILPKQ